MLQLLFPSQWTDDKISLMHRQCVGEQLKKKSKTNVLININHLTTIIAKVLWEIDKDDFNTIEQLGSKISTIVKETVNSSSG